MPPYWKTREYHTKNVWVQYKYICIGFNIQYILYYVYYTHTHIYIAIIDFLTYTFKTILHTYWLLDILFHPDMEIEELILKGSHRNLLFLQNEIKILEHFVLV